MKILFVDDNDTFREMLQYALESFGYVVETACDGLAGLEKLEEEAYDLLITDNHMPRMGGLKLIEETSQREMNVNGEWVSKSKHFSAKVKSQLGATLRSIISTENDLKAWTLTCQTYEDMRDPKRESVIKYTRLQMEECESNLIKLKNQASGLSNVSVDDMLDSYRYDCENEAVVFKNRKKVTHLL